MIRWVHGGVRPDQVLGAGLYNPDKRALDVSRWLAESAYRGAAHGHRVEVRGFDQHVDRVVGHLGVVPAHHAA